MLQNYNNVGVLSSILTIFHTQYTLQSADYTDRLTHSLTKQQLFIKQQEIQETQTDNIEASWGCGCQPFNPFNPPTKNKVVMGHSAL